MKTKFPDTVIEQIPQATSHKTAAVRPPASHLKNHPNKTDTAGEVRMNSWVMFSYGPLHIDMQELDDQLELINNISVRTQDVV